MGEKRAAYYACMTAWTGALAAVGVATSDLQLCSTHEHKMRKASSRVCASVSCIYDSFNYVF